MAYATVEVAWEGNTRLIGKDEWGHVVHMDAPTAIGGEGTAPSPLIFAIFGLAGCTMLDIVGILGKKREPLQGLTVSAEMDRREEHPRIASRVRLTYTVFGDVRSKSVEDAIRLSKTKYCSVSGMYSDEVKVELYWRRPDGEPVEVSID